MKKRIVVGWALALMLLLASCGSEPQISDGSQSSPTPSSDSSISSDGAASASEPQISDASQSSPTPSSESSISSDGAVSASEPESEQTAEDESKILVAYFSWADNAELEEEVDAVASPSVLPPGNVQQLAGWVQEQTGGELFSIQVTEPYSSDWNECLNRANQERGANARLDLSASVENMDSYDTVFLGYPNWWYGAPMAVLSFLEDDRDIIGLNQKTF